MGLLARMLGPGPQAATPTPSDDFWYQPVRSGETAAGVHVDYDAAASVAVAYACRKVLAEDLAGLPLILYRRGTDDQRERATDHPLYVVLHDQPNEFQSAFEFRELLMNWVVFRGNAYAQIVPGARGFVTELFPLHPDRVRPRLRSDGRVEYEYTPPRGPKRVIDQAFMFHLRGPSEDGVTGLSVIQTAAREYVGDAIAQREYGARFFAQDARPGGVLSHPQTLSDEAYRRLKEGWTAAHAGLTGAHRVAILEEGMQWTTVGLSNEDAQFIEARKLTRLEIASIFRMQPHKVGIMDNATFSNIEHQAIEHATDTIRPWTIRWEQAIRRQLLLPEERETLYAEHLMEDLVRGDLRSQFEAFNIAVNGGGHGGWMSPNEVRRRLNMPPLDGGDELIRPRQAVEQAKAATAASAAPGESDVLARARRIATEAAARLVRKEVAAIQKAASRHEGDWQGLLAAAETFYAGHARLIAESVQLSTDAAQGYTKQHLSALAEQGIAVLDEWEIHGGHELAELALGVAA